MTEYKKALPLPDPTTQPFWDGCKRHELLVQKCQQCGTLQYPPGPSCPACTSLALGWYKVSGKGTIYTYSIAHRQMLPNFDELPYAVVIVELDESPREGEARRLRLISNIVDCKPEDIYIGMPVEVVFEDVTDETTLPKFKPVRK